MWTYITTFIITLVFHLETWTSRYSIRWMRSFFECFGFNFGCAAWWKGFFKRWMRFTFNFIGTRFFEGGRLQDAWRASTRRRRSIRARFRFTHSRVSLWSTHREITSLRWKKNYFWRDFRLQMFKKRFLKKACCKAFGVRHTLPFERLCVERGGERSVMAGSCVHVNVPSNKRVKFKN